MTRGAPIDVCAARGAEAAGHADASGGDRTGAPLRVRIAGETVDLHAERALHWPTTQTLFVADVHLGKAAAFRAGGVPIPRGATAEDLARLNALIVRTRAKRLVVLGDFRDPSESAALVLGSIGFLPGEIESAEDVRSLARTRVFAGYAGWGAGQLEDEIGEGSWIVEPALPDDVFASEPDHLWSAVLRRKGWPFTALALMPGDVSRN